MLSQKILAWSTLYLITTCSLSTIFAILTLAYSVSPTKSLEYSLLLFPPVASLILICIGISSLLGPSLRRYPVLVGPSHVSYIERKRREHEEELGVILGITGLTSVFGMNPWQILFSLTPVLGNTVVAFIMATMLISLTKFCVKFVRLYFKTSK